MIDIDQNEELANEWKVTSIPDMRFLTSDGKEIGRYRGERTPEGFARAFSEAASKHAGKPTVAGIPETPLTRDAPRLPPPGSSDEPKIKLVEVDRLILKNGNRVDGSIIGTNDEEVLVRVKDGILGVRKEQIEKKERIVLRVKIEPPKPVVRTPPPPPSKPTTAVKEPTPPPPPAKKPEGTSKPVVIPVPQDDPDPDTRTKIQDLLTQMRKGSDTERQQVSEELTKLGPDGQYYLACAVQVAEDLSPWILAAMGHIESAKGFPVLVRILPDVSDPVKPLIFTVMGSRQYKDGIETIAPYLDHKDPLVSGGAVDSLAALQATDHFRKILSLLGSSDQTLSTRVMIAAETLARVPDFKEQAAIDIIEIIERGDNGRARGQAAMVAGRLAIPDAKPPMLELLNNENSETRANVVMALGEMKAPDTITPLWDRFLLETDRWVKVQIIQALEKIKNDAAIPLLIQALNDNDDQVRSRSSTALTTITGQPFGEDAEKWDNWYKSARRGQ